jgi:uncharacterized RDD family membrane protein YckC
MYKVLCRWHSILLVSGCERGPKIKGNRLFGDLFSALAAAPNGITRFRAVAFVVGFAVVLIAYHTILEGIAGATLGKWLLQIAVVREDCTDVGLRRSAVRNGVRLVDALPFVLPYLQGITSLGITENGSGEGTR